MTENIFENGGEFCQRGDELRRPVEWHLFTGATNSKYRVVYVNHGGTLETCGLDGCFAASSTPCDKDLIPIPSPPQIVPWESRKDVPAGIWVRHKQSGNVYLPTGFTESGIRAGAMFVSWQSLFEEYDLHTAHDADDGWQPCGKVVQS